MQSVLQDMTPQACTLRALPVPGCRQLRGGARGVVAALHRGEGGAGGDGAAGPAAW